MVSEELDVELVVLDAGDARPVPACAGRMTPERAREMLEMLRAARVVFGGVESGQRELAGSLRPPETTPGSVRHNDRLVGEAEAAAAAVRDGVDQLTEWEMLVAGAVAEYEARCAG